MPLSELLYRTAKAKIESSSQDKNSACSTDVSFVPETDFVELVWENGQIQPNRSRKIQSCVYIPPPIPKIKDKDAVTDTSLRVGKFGLTEPLLNDIHMSVPSAEVGLHQDDDIVPWLNYPIDDSLRQDGYYSEFSPGLSGVTVTEHCNHNNFAALFDKRSTSNQLPGDSYSASVHNGLMLDQANMPNLPSRGKGDSSRPQTTISGLYPAPSQQCQPFFPGYRSRVSAKDDASTSNAVDKPISISSSEGTFPGTKTPKQVLASSTATNPSAPATNPSVLNFSLFSRPAALAKSNLQSIEKAASKDKGSVASSRHPSETTFIGSLSGLRNQTSFQCDATMSASKFDSKQLDARGCEVPIPTELPEAVSQEGNSRNNRDFCQNFGDTANKGLKDGERSAEPMVASSVCSGNSVERASDDPSQSMKRKHRDTEESEGPSEDMEESVGAKKVPLARGSGSKRSRAAEVHNLSERRRRDRINEKMRALQELIPNCNKVDKASMLDEAIEYLKTLQLQVQIMSMGAGLYMPSIILPPGIPQMHAAHMAHFPNFPPMGVGMGMGMGFGRGAPEMNGGPSTCSMIQMPLVQGAQYPGMPFPGPSALPGMRGSNLQMFGLSGQAPPTPYTCTPLMPLCGQLPRAPLNGGGAVGPINSAAACSSKDPVEKTNSQVMQINGSSSSVNQTSIQCQATEERFEQPSLVQAQSDGQALEVTDNGALESVDVNDGLPTGGVR